MGEVAVNMRSAHGLQECLGGVVCVKAASTSMLGLPSRTLNYHCYSPGFNPEADGCAYIAPLVHDLSQTFHRLVTFLSFV